MMRANFSIPPLNHAHTLLADSWSYYLSPFHIKNLVQNKSSFARINRWNDFSPDELFW